MNPISSIAIRLLILLLLSNNLFAKDVSVVVEHWPPWEIAEDPKRQQVTTGIAVELAREIFRRYGKEVTLKTAPWKRALGYIKTGEVDVIPMILQTEERKKHMVFTEPMYTDPLVFAYTTDGVGDFEWSSWQDLKPYRIGTVRAYEYGVDWKIASQEYNLSVFESATDASSIKMLMAGRNELALLFYSVATEILKDVKHAQKVKFSKKPVSASEFRFGISKESDLSKNVNQINRIMNNMRKDGTYKKIMGPFYL